MSAKFQKYEAGYDAYQRINPTDFREMTIDLPFRVDNKGFIDPLNQEDPHEDAIFVGVFPILDRKSKDPMKADPKWATCLVFGLEAAEKPKIVGQKTTTKDHSGKKKVAPGFHCYVNWKQEDDDNDEEQGNMDEE